MESSIVARLGTAMLLAMLFGATAVSAAPSAETMHRLEVFGQVLALSEANHVTPIDDDRAIEAAISGLTQSLDPNSSYITPESYQKIGKGWIGVGLMLRSDDGKIIVTGRMDGSPAAEGGLLPGDEIVAVDDHMVRGQSLASATEYLSGPVNEPTTLTVARGQGPDIKVSLVRKLVTYRPTAFEVISGIGKLKIAALDGNVESDVKSALSSINTGTSRANGLVLDLRDCPGGALNKTVAVAGMFLGKQEVLSQHGRDPADLKHYYGYNGADESAAIPLTVLVNGGTASGCELIAAALQDHHRATIVGTVTAGRGTIQTIIPINGGKDGAIKLTTSYIYRPSNKPIDGVGVTPDVIIDQSRSPTGQASEYDAQFNRAVEVLQHKPAGT